MSKIKKDPKDKAGNNLKADSEYSDREPEGFESESDYSENELADLEREAKEEVIRNFITGNEYFPKASYLEENKYEFIEIKRIWDKSVFNLNPKLLAEIQEVMTCFFR